MSPKRKLTVQETKKEPPQRTNQRQTKRIVARPSPPTTSSENDAAANNDPDSSSEEQTIAELESAILELLRSRAPGSNCCPSEIPRRMPLASSSEVPSAAGEKRRKKSKKEKQEEGWRALMPATRKAAARLVERGLLVITQGGLPVSDPRSFKGPIRLKLADSLLV